MQTKGVLYLNLGTKCISRMLVSIHSLKKHYNGPISIVSIGDESNKFFDSINDQLIKQNINIIKENFKEIPEGKNIVFLMKTSINKCTPYDLSVFLDADTLVRGNIDELFELAEKHDFVAPKFTNWTTKTKAITRRIESWRSTYPDLMKGAFEYEPALNCGVFAFKKNAHYMLEWYQKTLPNRGVFIPDETAMQCIVHLYKHFACDQKYNVSCKYSTPKDPDTRVIHYHGRKHCRMKKDKILYGGELWMEEYNQAASENFLNISSSPKDKYIKALEKSDQPTSQKQINKETTIVTVVDEKTLPKFLENVKTWDLKPDIKNLHKIIFTIGNCIITDLELSNYKVIGYPLATDRFNIYTDKAVKEVTTPYWLKIDPSIKFTNDAKCLLDHFYNYDIVGNREWSTIPGQSLIELDEWAEEVDVDGDVYISDSKNIPEEYKHNVISTYFSLNNTSFTKEAVGHLASKSPKISDDGLFYWYMANRLPDEQDRKQRWAWHHMKKLGIEFNNEVSAIPTSKPKQTVVMNDFDFTIVSAVNPPYLDKLKLTLPTWQRKPQFANKPAIIFHNGFSSNENPPELNWIREYLFNYKLIHWDMEKYDSQRELMLSSFVFGAAAYVETPYWVKIDGDAFFTNSNDVFDKGHLEYDIVGHSWHYSKPGKWLNDLDNWANANKIPGENFLKTPKEIETAIKSNRYGHKRIASFMCLHKTDFTVEAALAAGDRLPVPSHDTYMWYYAFRTGKKISSFKIKKRGCLNNTNINEIQRILCQINL
jgi:hypothetical protein